MNDLLFLIQLFFVAIMSTFVHELGHGIVSYLRKAERVEINLGLGKCVLSFSVKNIYFYIRTYFFIGGFTKSIRKIPYTKWEQVWISLAGPLSNLICFIIAFELLLFWRQGFLLYMVFYNGWLLIVNMIPFKYKGSKSDGYVILKAIMGNSKQDG